MKQSEPTSPGAPAPSSGAADGPAPSAREAGKFAVDWAHRERAVDELVGELDRRATRRRHRRRLAGAVGAASLLLTIFAWRTIPGQNRPGSVPESVVVSLPSRQVLADGSVVELRDTAEIAVAFTASLRRVVLKRGEAHFQVVKNGGKPFVVQVGAIEVRAIGTAFIVNLDWAAAEVLVTEGSVAVEKPAVPAGSLTVVSQGSAPATLALIEAGNRAVIAAAPASVTPTQVQAVSGVELAERLAWRVPRLEFSGTPLADAIGMFNRYNDVQFELADPSLGRLKVSGFLRADMTDTFVRLLESDFGLAVDRRSAREIVLRRAP